MSRQIRVPACSQGSKLEPGPRVEKKLLVDTPGAVTRICCRRLHASPRTRTCCRAAATALACRRPAACNQSAAHATRQRDDAPRHCSSCCKGCQLVVVAAGGGDWWLLYTDLSASRAVRGNTEAILLDLGGAASSLEGRVGANVCACVVGVEACTLAHMSTLGAAHLPADRYEPPQPQQPSHVLFYTPSQARNTPARCHQ